MWFLFSAAVKREHFNKRRFLFHAFIHVNTAEYCRHVSKRKTLSASFFYCNTNIMVFISGYILQTFSIFGSLILTFLIGLIPLTCCLLLSVLYLLPSFIPCIRILLCTENMGTLTRHQIFSSLTWRGRSLGSILQPATVKKKIVFCNNLKICRHHAKISPQGSGFVFLTPSSCGRRAETRLRRHFSITLSEGHDLLVRTDFR